MKKFYSLRRLRVCGVVVKVGYWQFLNPFLIPAWQHSARNFVRQFAKDDLFTYWYFCEVDVCHGTVFIKNNSRANTRVTVPLTIVKVISNEVHKYMAHGCGYSVFPSSPRQLLQAWRRERTLLHVLLLKRRKSVLGACEGVQKYLTKSLKSTQTLHHQTH